MGIAPSNNGLRSLRSRLRLPLRWLRLRRLPRLRLRPVRPFPRGGEEDREAEEKAFKDAEAKAKELMEAEKKQYEDFVEAQKKAVDEAVAKEKEFYEKERELAIKLGSHPFAAGYGYPYGAGYGYPYGAGYGYAGRGYGYGYPYGRYY